MKENKQPILSICIPTWNRWYSLQYTLKSIIDQNEFKSGDVEIVISDNASTDETEIEVGKLCRKYKNIRYSKNKENIGAMQNINKVMSLGTGKYIWCFGSDDIMLTGCLKMNIMKLKEYNPVMTINFNGTNPSKFVILRNKYYNEQGNFYVFTSQKDFFNYIGDQYVASKESYQYLGSLITWISSVCIRKDYYDNAKQKVIDNMGIDFFNSFDFIHGFIFHYIEIDNPIVLFLDFYVKANREIANLNKKKDLQSYEVGHNRLLTIRYIKEAKFMYKYFIRQFSLNNNFIAFTKKDINGWVFGSFCNIPLLRNLRYYMPSNLKSKILTLFGKV